MKYREGSCCSKLSKCKELRENDGGIYTEHMVISLSRVTETAVAGSTVCKSIFIVGKMILQILRHHQKPQTNVMNLVLYILKLFNEMLSFGF